ncbi:apoptosis inhibitor 2-like protein [Leptotrombidium deliense]|uniref:Apoptosis inhibitor 2-like protein n=1 Tax=Leptotrombidium deliense TaxID=299467 RepID=A0A443RT59_9ACAR|nr:apoptosis inhibitor 2-like protein [Leptotrombidium deliense]
MSYFNFTEAFDEEFRAKTFTFWPHEKTLAKELAKVGFVNLKWPADSVECVFCGGELHKWKRTKFLKLEPSVVHRLFFPNCPLVTGQCTSNEPISEDPYPKNNNYPDHYYNFCTYNLRDDEYAQKVLEKYEKECSEATNYLKKCCCAKEYSN